MVARGRGGEPVQADVPDAPGEELVGDEGVLHVRAGHVAGPVDAQDALDGRCGEVVRQLDVVLGGGGGEVFVRRALARPRGPVVVVGGGPAAGTRVAAAACPRRPIPRSSSG